MPDPYYEDARVRVFAGDCLDVLTTLPDASVDAVVTDPPYGLGFMGREWDDARALASRPPSADETDARYRNAFPRTGKGPAAVTFDGRAFQAWCELWAAECLRVLKPGGHLLAFGGTRTSHRLACAIEDAGFEIRDSIAWLYGSGFPKSLDVSKAIDKAAGAEREVVGRYASPEGTTGPASRSFTGSVQSGPRSEIPGAGLASITAPATDDARTWQGWGTALKPAHEPIVVARKPLTGSVAANVLRHGTGALNIDGCRVGDEERIQVAAGTTPGASIGALSHGNGDAYEPGDGRKYRTGGRWPANVVLDESQAAALDQQSGTLTSGALSPHHDAKPSPNGSMSGPNLAGRIHSTFGGDTGGASRFFYVAKADSAERPRYRKEGAGEGRVTGLGGKVRECNACGSRAINSGATELTCGHQDHKWVDNPRPEIVAHPTVKPLALMRWLVRLVTPPGGTVLEPFAGSGATVEACVLEGFRCIAIERETDYLPLITSRLNQGTLDFGEELA